MKLLHLSDLHLGKRVNGFSMIEDQEYILKKIINIVDEEKPDGVIIAGDVYDKTIPPAEAVKLFDDFIVSFSKRNVQVYIISGNHDSPERLSFGGRLMENSGIHISPVYNGVIKPISFVDEYGTVNIYMLPFVKPANVSGFFEDDEILSYTDAVGAAIKAMNADKSERNILITHQFVTGAVRSESEEISVGGTDNVDSTVFECFDYVALGHIHVPQNIGSQGIRYCGTPLKYSFSEVNHKKSVTAVELFEKGNIEVRTIPLIPLRDMKEIKGSYEELVSKSFYENTSYRQDYVHITLTDENDVPDASAKLRVIYRNLMKLDYDNTRTRNKKNPEALAEELEKKTPIELFSDFYEKQNGQPMSYEQTNLVKDLIEKIWEEML